jgi:hypothetical protein
MTTERKILEEMTVKILKNYLDSETALLSSLTAYFDKIDANKKEIPSGTKDTIITYITEYLKAVRLYINLLEKTSFNEIIKAYVKEHEQQMQESEELVEQVFIKTSTYIQ